MKTNMKLKIASTLAAAVTVFCTTTVPASAKYNNSSVKQKEAYGKSYQKSWLSKEKKKFPDGKSWNKRDSYGNADPDGYTDTPCTGNGSIHSAGGRKDSDLKLTKSNIYSPNYTKALGSDSHSQCSGFAYKLASDFFGGADAWIRYWEEETNGVQLRVGDQVRIEEDGRMNVKEHYVFITNVNGNSLTFADCNANGGCLIRWDVKAALSGSDFIYNGLKYKITQIDRPIMAGDVNGDSVFNATDIQLILQIAKRNEIDPQTGISRGAKAFAGKQKAIMMEAADLNNDGDVTWEDWDMAWDEWNYNTTVSGTCGNMRFLTNVGNWN